MKCTLVSATEKQEETEITGIFVQAVNGELGVLTGHQPLIAKLLDNSAVRLKTSAPAQKIYTVGADSFLQFAGDEAVILTQSFSAPTLVERSRNEPIV
jgi:F0F1-type ATP synthase epsilon subunit